MNRDGTLFSFLFAGVDAPHVYVRAGALGCFQSYLYRNLIASVDSWAEIVPLQWRNQIWQSLEEGAGKRCAECAHAACPSVLQSPALTTRFGVSGSRVTWCTP